MTAPTTPVDIQRGRGRRVWWIAMDMVLAVGLAIGVVAYVRPPAGGGEARAPSFRLENLREGEPPVELAAFRGSPVVVNFWASWCGPCRREMPAFQAVFEELGGGVDFVGVNHQDTRPEALDLVAETGVRYPSGHDPRGTIATDFGLFGMPTTIFVSADGEIMERRTGELSRTELRDTIRRRFGV